MVIEALKHEDCNNVLQLDIPEGLKVTYIEMHCDHCHRIIFHGQTFRLGGKAKK
jgi:hypothetical protein